MGERHELVGDEEMYAKLLEAVGVKGELVVATGVTIANRMIELESGTLVPANELLVDFGTAIVQKKKPEEPVLEEV